MQFIDKNDPVLESRFDLTLLKHLSETDNVRAIFDEVKTSWRQNQLYNQQGLSQLKPDLAITSEEEDKAIQSCLDYHFEKYYLPTMTAVQANAYMLSIDKVLTFPNKLSVDSGSPLLIESSHHQSIYSILYWLVINIAQLSNYDHVIMMHQQEAIDPRLTALRSVGKACHNIDFDLIRFDSKSQWYKLLKKNVTDNTIILYLGDMPTTLTEFNNFEPADSPLVLTRTGSAKLSLKRFSAAKKIAEKFKAKHYISNIQNDNSVKLSPVTEGLELTCPLDSWIFWPALESLYV